MTRARRSTRALEVFGVGVCLYDYVYEAIRATPTARLAAVGGRTGMVCAAVAVERPRFSVAVAHPRPVAHRPCFLPAFFSAVSRPISASKCLFCKALISHRAGQTLLLLGPKKISPTPGKRYDCELTGAVAKAVGFVPVIASGGCHVSAFFQNRHYWRALRTAPIGGIPSRGARIFQKKEEFALPY